MGGTDILATVPVEEDGEVLQRRIDNNGTEQIKLRRQYGLIAQRDVNAQYTLHTEFEFKRPTTSL